MLACLTVPSDERLQSLVRGFGRDFAGALRVPDDEAARLAGALDAAVQYVCDNAYPGDPTGRIEITLEPAERGIRVAVHDWGRPVTSAEGPGVAANLAAGVEDVRLINLGAEGKRLSFVCPTTLAVGVHPGASDAPAPAAAAAASAITVRDGGPDDAEQIAQLLYENYALSYVHPDFYRPRWLREQLLAGRVLSAVAVDGSEVVGHHALMPAPDAPAGETGIAVVAPAYRGLGIFGRLGDYTLARARALGLPAVYGQAVTIHPYSQRAELAHGYHETAVCLAGSPAGVAMRGLATGHAGSGRTALMISFLPLSPAPRRASLPGRHRERLLRTYDGLGLAAPAAAGGAAPAPGRISVARDIETAMAVLTITGWDDELLTRATGTVRTLLAEHLDVIYADLDLAATADVDAAVEALGGLGFSYSGLWLHGPGGHDHLRLQRLNCTEAELGGIATASPAGAELLRYVLADLEQVAGA